ncbi:unnamed protein product [Notodromas monacha]|uniref:Trimeric intracellular cation channel type B n=1 Tax=Notodromas monacha TaxID=399045 RepID=A0A7R9GEC0_9CRUS|nr:unnamed protein product [Notodromas monacha]CAG0917899.1 unnamed protein product [Notodromas monacha]
MDPEAFLDLANQATKLKMFPYFDIAHSAISCLYVREDLGAGALQFSRKHPLACWLSCMLSIFAGGIFAAVLLGEPLLGVFKSTDQLLIATAVWYVVFYTPFDIGYKVLKFLPIKLLLAAMKEVYRCKKVHDGVVHAAKIYPNGYVAMVVIGTVKGNGAGFLKILERLLRGVWTPTALEILHPTFPTKACFIASIIFLVDKKTELISAPHSLVYFGIVIFFVYFKLSSVLLGIHDPFIPFENIFSMLFLGGIWDAMQKAMSGTGSPKTDTGNSSASEASKSEAQKKKD